MDNRAAYRMHLVVLVLSFLSLTASFSTTSLASSTDFAFSVFFTQYKDPNAERTTTFACEDNYIYVFVKWQNLEGRHTAEAVWHNPKGKIQDYSKHEFEIAGEDLRWFSLELIRPTRLVGNIDLSFTPDPFFGRWNVDIYLDGKFLLRRYFNVLLCG